MHHKVYKDEDMLIKVIPLNEESDPDIYISKVSDRGLTCLIEREISYVPGG